MEESEKRRERLKAMRTEASQAVFDNEVGAAESHHLSNPLIETSAVPPLQTNSYATPRFDYYTDPMSAFSADKRRGNVSNLHSQDCLTPPRPRHPEMTPPPAYQARPNYSPDQSKLALFYDWLFFDESFDNVMNIEPAILLIVHSIPKYIDMTHTLLEFLFLLMENYDFERKDIINRGILSAFCTLVRKGVVHSFDVLINCDALAPFLKQRLAMLFSGMKACVPINFDQPSRCSSLNLPKTSTMESQTPLQEDMEQ